MKITRQRTRLIITEYTESEMRLLKRLVSLEDKDFFVSDEYAIYFMPGMFNRLNSLSVPKIIIDQRYEHWKPQKIKNVVHSAEPRNQMQKDFINFLLKNHTKYNSLVGILRPGGGKGNPYSMRIPAPNSNGFIRMGDIKISDKIFGSDGKPNTVQEIYELGCQNIYKVTFSDGRSSLCTEDHLWNVITPWDDNPQTLSLKNILVDYKINKPFVENSLDDKYIYNYRIPLLSEPVQYNSSPVPVDAYIVGSFLANGSCCELYKYLPELLGVPTKHRTIPNIYKYNDLNTRINLLKGLLDTSGDISYNHNDGLYHIKFNFPSNTMLEEVQELLRGLGCIPKVIKNKNINNYEYDCSVHCIIPRHIEKIFSDNLIKSTDFKENNNELNDDYKYLTIVDIKFSHRENARCIKVSAPDSLYLAEDFIVTHNTFMACYSAIKIGLRTLILAPTTNVRQQWADTLTDMFDIDPNRVSIINSVDALKKFNGDFAVMLSTSLSSIIMSNKITEEELKQLGFGIKIVDEVQMLWNATINIDTTLNLANNWYLTGTFGRSSEDEHKLYKEMFLDAIVFDVPLGEKTLFNRVPKDKYGYKPHTNLIMIWTSAGLNKKERTIAMSSNPDEEGNMSRLRYGVSNSKHAKLTFPEDKTVTPWLNVILKVLFMSLKEVNYGKTLMLVPTISSVDILAYHVKKHFPNEKVGTVHSKNSKEENDRTKAEADIIISTVKSSGTGFDVKGLSKLICAEQFKSWILAQQVLGRLREREDGKETFMWDIVDSDFPQYRKWANVRYDSLRRSIKSFKSKKM